MKGTQQLHDIGQSLWLDNITQARRQRVRKLDHLAKEKKAHVGGDGSHDEPGQELLGGELRAEPASHGDQSGPHEEEQEEERVGDR